MKQDRQGVRTPAELERKYNFASDTTIKNLATEAQRIAKQAEATVDSLAARVAELENSGGGAVREWELIETILVDEGATLVSRETDYLALGLRIIIGNGGGETRSISISFTGQDRSRTAVVDCLTEDCTAEIYAWVSPEKGFARCFVSGAIEDWSETGASVKCSGTINLPVKGFSVAETEIGGLPADSFIEVYGMRG